METLRERLETWEWSTWVFPGLAYKWEWEHGEGWALMPAPDTCAVKIVVHTFDAVVSIFNRTIPGDIDWRLFDVKAHGGARTGRATNPIDLSEFRVDDFCLNIEKYIGFFMGNMKAVRPSAPPTAATGNGGDATFSVSPRWNATKQKLEDDNG